VIRSFLYFFLLVLFSVSFLVLCLAFAVVPNGISRNQAILCLLSCLSHAHGGYHGEYYRFVGWFKSWGGLFLAYIAYLRKVVGIILFSNSILGVGV